MSPPHARLERVTGIEPAPLAWEFDRSKPLTTLTWAADAPPVTVIDRVTPWLMARQWPKSRMQPRLAAPVLDRSGAALRQPARGSRSPVSSRPDGRPQSGRHH